MAKNQFFYLVLNLKFEVRSFRASNKDFCYHIKKKFNIKAIKDMDKFNENIKAPNPYISVNSENQKQGQALNFQATAKYIELICEREKLINTDLKKDLSDLKNSLTELLKQKDSLESQDFNDFKDESYIRLIYELLKRDLKLSEITAQYLSTSKRFIRQNEALDLLKEMLNHLCPVLKALPFAKFICQILVNLTDLNLLGAGIERDLIIHDVKFSKEKITAKVRVEVEKLLKNSLAFIELNNDDYLKTLPKIPVSLKKAPLIKEKTTAQVMTHYLRKALEEFPKDNDYLDEFKHPDRRLESSKYEDEMSLKTALRIKDIIKKAADIAKKGNLLPESCKEVKKEITASAKAWHNTQSIKADEGNLTDASKLSLSELAARAARLQKQFRQERRKMADEGKLPDPAIMPKPPKAPVKPVKKEVEVQKENEPLEITSTGDKRQDDVLKALSALARRSQVIAASKQPQETTKDSAPIEGKEKASSDIGSMIMKNTVPLSELENSTVPSDIKDAGLNENSLIKEPLKTQN